MRRMTSIFGGAPKPPAGETERERARALLLLCVCVFVITRAARARTLNPTLHTPPPTQHNKQKQTRKTKQPKGGNPDSNTLISDMTTVICLDDYHSLDRKGRSEKGVTALAPEAQNFELMAAQVKALKEGKAVDKPIYNHVSGLLDPAENIASPNVSLVFGFFFGFFLCCCGCGGGGWWWWCFLVQEGG
jgi:hypothetical protein